MKLDATWPFKMGDRLVADIGPQELQRRVKALTPLPRNESEEAREGGFYSALILGMFYEKVGENGETRAQLWESKGWSGLNNDERVMTRYRRQSYLTVLETQEVVREGLATQCLDLLDPNRAPFTVYDRMMAAALLPFSRVLSWVTDYPHYTRVGGSAVILEHTIANNFIAAIRQRAGTAEPARVRAYLLDHYREIMALREEIANRRHDEIIEEADGRLHTLTCRVHDYGEVADILRNQGELVPAPPDESDARALPGQLHCYEWLRVGGSSDAPSGAIQRFITSPDGSVGPELFSVLRLFPDRLIAETLGTKRARYVRKRLGDLLGDLISFDREKVDDFGERARQNRLKASAAPPAPAPLEALDPATRQTFDRISEAVAALPDEERALLLRKLPRQSKPKPRPAPPSDSPALAATEAFVQKIYRDLLDNPAPALDDLSPREASRRPEMADRLEDWAKMHMHSIAEHRARQGGGLDLAWFFAELGMSRLWRR